MNGDLRDGLSRFVCDDLQANSRLGRGIVRRRPKTDQFNHCEQECCPTAIQLPDAAHLTDRGVPASARDRWLACR